MMLKFSLIFGPLPESARWRATRPGDVLDRRIRAELDGAGARGTDFRGLEAVRPFAFHVRQRWLQLLLVALALRSLADGISAARGFADYGASQFGAFRLIAPQPPRKSPSGASEAAVMVSVRLLRRGCEVLSHSFDGHAPAPLLLSAPLVLDGVDIRVRAARLALGNKSRWDRVEICGRGHGRR